MHRRIDSYEQALEFLYSRVNFERQSSTQYGLGDFLLDRMRQLLQRLGNPQDRLPTVHIAGTKGKGSTAAMLASVLSAAGHRTGLFTSPHITQFEERFTVDGRQPTPDELVELVNQVADVVQAMDEMPGAMSPTYFEIVTALGWLYFSRQEAQLVVLEVGLGGRLDSTNICRPIVCVITSISRDHTKQLGYRVEQIAAEKGGIIKAGVPVVSGVLDPAARGVIEQIASERGCRLVQLGRELTSAYHPGAPSLPGGNCGIDHFDVSLNRQHWSGLPLALLGEHQARNGALVLAVVAELRAQGWMLPDEAIERGLRETRWASRIEVLGEYPAVIVDGGHNWAAVAALVETLTQRFRARRRILVFAASQDKDVAGMLRQLYPVFDTIILTAFHNNPRNLPAGELAQLSHAMSSRLVHVTNNSAAAWKLARRLAGPEDLICVTGSFFLAAELREQILEECRGTASQTLAGQVRHK
ncbi:MAG: bifunctional folylpolyglutamate synthase/dihydrofolate synthase [Planctomycetaceae bacterium]